MIDKKETIEEIQDREAIESAFKQIRFYNNLPKHIKGAVSELKDLISVPVESFGYIPAHVVSGEDLTTVVNGKLNIPTIWYAGMFGRRTESYKD